MTEITHDPSEYIKGIYSILINSKKRIGFLFGAGTSQAKKEGIKSITVPAIYELTKIVEEEVLKEKDKEDKLIYKEVIDSLKEDLKEKYNIESILSILEQKHLIIGNNKLNGLDKSGFENLIVLIKSIIRKRMSVHDEITDYDSQVQTDFSRWIGKADRTFGIEIFTTNYDYLFEIGLEHHDIAYYDGFSGSFRPFFNPESVEDFKYLPFQTKLWKIHGSIGWHVDKKTDKTIRDSSNNEDIFIFPSVFKYKDSQKQPFISLLDRLTNFLKQDDTVLFTCGYAFNDEHINGRILSALNVDRNSHVIALYWDEYKNDGTSELLYSLNSESHLYKLATSNSKLSVLGFRSAIIGRQLGTWKLRKEPDRDETPHVNLYFDEDHHTDLTDELNKKLSVKWSGEGKFIIPDFTHFVKFLNSMIVENSLSNAIKKDGIK